MNLLLTSYNVAGAFMDAISNMDFEFVASRHYAKVIHHLTDETNELLFLQLSKDTVKDQTYFLSCLSQAQLKRLVLPLGCIPKFAYRRKDGIGIVQLPEDDQGLATGPFAAFYQQELCVGSGVILESWDDAKGFPVSVSDKARHIAKMEDKSKLGKPVKIKPKP
ncbi:unnamed protein product [Lactuca virosa]|uniref:tRNA-specific 2-thiouridylase MnmA-like C-terminal domain-containing protein n=1 Tax=Lactuca virosa TaxID=75947 RepID=A0AAU9PWD0_9ASTR|nr:unnamed protein product [Lactuca virosa]